MCLALFHAATILMLVAFDGFSPIARSSQLFATPAPKR